MRREFGVGITVNVALVLALITFIYKAGKWVERIDNSIIGTNTRVEALEESLNGFVGDRWRRSDTLMYHVLAQTAVDAWAERNELTPFVLPPPYTPQEQ